ncbi:MAG: hypothetical protein MMC23_008527 [Stictis urceolatum]|nr:hypothetical protein [Stictis urceolata]
MPNLDTVCLDNFDYPSEEKLSLLQNDALSRNLTTFTSGTFSWIEVDQLLHLPRYIKHLSLGDETIPPREVEDDFNEAQKSKVRYLDAYLDRRGVLAKHAGEKLAKNPGEGPGVPDELRQHDPPAWDKDIDAAGRSRPIRNHSIFRTTPGFKDTSRVGNKRRRIATISFN